ncbi:MAG TPA: sulfatase-like hydrolase/transferase [Gemmatimonadaceae bacterium]|nr:sulfatase-like hydrolase/transferase [Gemmatimonadaceae bacterium]
MATLAIFANVLGLIVFLQSRSDRLLAAVVDPLHPDWVGMERAFAGFTIYAASLLGAVLLAALFGFRHLVRRLRAHRAEGEARSGAGATIALAVALTACVVLVFIEVLIFQDYGIHFYEFDVFGILADAALRRDLGIQPAEVARVTAAALGLIVVEITLCVLAVRLVRWRNGALPRACGAAMLVAIPGGFAMFRSGEEGIGPLRSEFESALPLGRQLLMRRDSRPHIAVRPRVGPGGYPVLAAADSAPRLSRRPNIVFHVPDGLRADMVRPDLTPTLLAFAQRGDVITSDRHYSTGHVSEAGIFGLLYGLRSQAFNAFIGERVPAFPIEVLKRNGYRTLFVSSSRLNPYPTDQLTRMFDDVIYPENDDAALVALREYVAERSRDGAPYFILAFLYTPHFPFTSAKPHLRRFPSVGPKARPNYMNDVIQADDYLRQTLALFPSGDSTVYLVTSDHGEEIRDHGVFGHASATFWNEKVQVPFFLRLPGLRASAARSRSAFSSHTDVWPTIFDHLGMTPGVDAAAWSDGRSLLRGESGQLPVVNGRFFPFADRPNLIVDGQRKIWFRADRVGAEGRLCLETTRVTDLHDRPLAIEPGRDAATLSRMEQDFWRFLVHSGSTSAPCGAGSTAN